jgi:GntR family transcriptional regulator/MocR family aminotransferase
MSPHRLQARDLLVRVDRASATPVGRQIEEQLRRAIRTGSLTPGSGLPSTRALAEDLGVSRGVVVRAYAQLAAAGFIEVRQGANPHVRGIPGVAEPAAAPDGGGKILYDLRPQQVDVSTFPRRLWLRSTEQAVTSATNAELGYIDRHGLARLRTEIAGYLGRARGVVADPERIVVAAGGTHALSLLARTLVQRGSTLTAFENPSSRVVHAVARHAGLEPVGIPIDEHGLRTDMLGDEAAVVVSPANQFPTGVALTQVRRTALIAWAQRTGGLVVENDYDAEFRYDAAIGAMQSLAPEHVAYVGSTGKTLAPAIRLGWVVLPESLHADVAEELSASMMHVSGMDQLAFADFVRRGEFDRHLRRLRKLYRRRRDVMVDALAKHLPDLFVTEPAAGLAVVVELRDAALEPRVVAAARAAGVLVPSLSQHALPGYDGPAGIVVGFGSLPEPTIPLAVERLAAAVKSVS